MFEEYHYELRGPTNIHEKFLKNAQWQNHCGVLGYYATSTRQQGLFPVEFNFDHLCWVEVRYLRTECRWLAKRITDPDLGLQILLTDLSADELTSISGDSDTGDNMPSALTSREI